MYIHPKKFQLKKLILILPFSLYFSFVFCQTTYINKEIKKQKYWYAFFNKIKTGIDIDSFRLYNFKEAPKQYGSVFTVFIDYRRHNLFCRCYKNDLRPGINDVSICYYEKWKIRNIKMENIFLL